ncbi:hypothetical protein HWV62_6233 [Athelia sp. TMB]|nr:hypothetical protein HWV62_6233 [Athelia sp. TMB]
MREILYIQAGPLANYTGTHFWNTQEAYFTYGDDADEPLVDHAISFREAVVGRVCDLALISPLTHRAPGGAPSLAPRQLTAANFGTLSKDLLSQDDSSQDDTGTNLWYVLSPSHRARADDRRNGDVVEYRQPAIEKSPYHDKLDNDGEDADGDDAPAVRYWSDFNRLYYPPKTVQKLPDVADWEDKEGDWEDGRALFRRFDEDTDLMDDAVRAFAEECDALQGVQLTYDTGAAGGFTDALLGALRDEYAKLSLLAFPLLSDALAAPLDVDDHRGRRKALNDALVLRSLHELVPLSVPLQSPRTWPKTLDGVQGLNTGDMYRTSALLSAHIESATLPLRLRAGREDLASYASHLTWRGTTRFAELSGRADADFDSRLFNYSALDSAEAGADLEFATRDVARGFSLPQTAAYEKWRAGYHLREPFFLSTHAPLYPLPTSFPPIFPTAPEKRAHTIPLFTSLSTTPRTAALLRRHATFVEANLGAGGGTGLDRDEMKELGNDLWRVCDGYDGEDGGGAAEEGDYGEDEE